jgi:hypothetical protein
MPRTLMVGAMGPASAGCMVAHNAATILAH